MACVCYHIKGCINLLIAALSLLTTMIYHTEPVSVGLQHTKIIATQFLHDQKALLNIAMYALHNYMRVNT